jgi:D-glycero-D-manno-heptose 1,7-bisphosphate phosphatase
MVYEAEGPVSESNADGGRIVILGASGVIGRELVALCTALGRPYLAISSWDIDLSGPGAAEALGARLAPADSIVLLAAVPPDIDRGAAGLLRNAEIARATAAAARRADIRHLLYLSSDGVYSAQDGAVTETSPVAASDCYRAGHLAREAIVRADFLPERLCIVRATQIYSRHDSHFAYGPCRFARDLAAGRRIALFGAGEERRDHMSAEDLVRIVLDLSDQGACGTVNAATGRSVSFAELAQRMLSLVGRDSEEVSSVPRRQPLFHRDFDIARLTALLGPFQFEPLERGLARLLVAARSRQEPMAGARPAVFLDRDGVLNENLVVDGKPYAPRRFQDFRLYPEAATAIVKFKAAGFATVVVTNQPDLGHGLIEPSQLQAMHAYLERETGVDAILTCPHRQDEGCGCRKPGAGLLVRAAYTHNLDLSRSVMVGDRASDVAAGRDAGCRTIFIDRAFRETRSMPKADIVVGGDEGLDAAAEIILRDVAREP